MRCLSSTSLRWRHSYFYCGDYLDLHPRRGIKKGIGVFAETLISLKWPILSIGMVLAFAFVTNYSGMSTTLALVLAGTGVMFPFFSPFLGWLGVFLTGSDTSSNALFGSLQSTTAQQINVSDTLLVAANTSGGVTGKMISRNLSPWPAPRRAWWVENLNCSATP